jgi:hypothetical protein
MEKLRQNSDYFDDGENEKCRHKFVCKFLSIHPYQILKWFHLR